LFKSFTKPSNRIPAEVIKEEKSTLLGFHADNNLPDKPKEPTPQKLYIGRSLAKIFLALISLTIVSWISRMSGFTKAKNLLRDKNFGAPPTPLTFNLTKINF
jgi:hypothetical protein